MQSSGEVVVLRSREIVRLEDVAGARLRVLRGSVWLTQHGDPKDHYLPASGAITLDRPGLVLVHALETAELDVRQPAPKSPVAARVARAIARWAVHRFGPEGIDNQRLHGWHGAL